MDRFFFGVFSLEREKTSKSVAFSFSVSFFGLIFLLIFKGDTFFFEYFSGVFKMFFRTDFVVKFLEKASIKGGSTK